MEKKRERERAAGGHGGRSGRWIGDKRGGTTEYRYACIDVDIDR